MSAEPTSASPAGSAARRRRARRSRSIRRSILRIILVPAVPLVLLSLGGAGWLIGTGYYVRAIAVSVRQVSLPALSGLASMGQERALSLAALSGTASDPRALAAQRQTTDRGLAAMRQAAASAMTHAPDQIADRMKTLTTRLDRLPSIRAQVDAGAISADDTAAYYDHTLDSATRLFDTQARIVPDATATQGAIASVDLFRISDIMSRAGGVGGTALAAGQMSPDDARDFARLVDTYRQRLDTVTPNLRPDVRAGITHLRHSSSWTRLTDAEDTLMAAGAWRHHAPAGTPSSAAWNRLTGAVSRQLIKLVTTQGDQVSAQALAAGTHRLALATGLSAAALLVAAAAIWLAVRASGTLVHGTLIPRISALGDEADRLVVRLVDMIGRLRAGDQVDVAAERLQLTPAAEGDSGQGGDEIAKVAAVINQAVATAADVAVREAEGRQGAREAVLRIARRHQSPLHQVLRHLSEWEKAEEDADRLERWFTLHYLANQIRSMTDGLIILTGGQPGRPTRRDHSLLEVLRLAQADAVHYQRVKVEHPPEVQVSGSAISNLVPLLTRLLDNATGFSHPDAAVTVRSMRVAVGVVVEIEDRGAGMSPEVREQANTLLREAPDFTVAALGAGARIGLWVAAHLAHRLNVTVELRASPYGGVLAIVLLPEALLAADHQQPDARSAPAPAIAPPPRPPAAPSPVLRAVREPGASLGGLPPSPADTSGRHSYPAVGRTTMPTPSPSPAPPGPRPDLPARRRGQHLAPQLRTDQPSDAPAASMPSSPDDTRERLSALQRGSRAGRRPQPAAAHPPMSTDRNENGT